MAKCHFRLLKPHLAVVFDGKVHGGIVVLHHLDPLVLQELVKIHLIRVYCYRLKSAQQNQRRHKQRADL